MTWVRFGQLASGERFRFVYNLLNPRLSEEVYTKVDYGWYTDAQDKRWTTGQQTAVQVVTHKPQIRTIDDQLDWFDALATMFWAMRKNILSTDTNPLTIEMDDEYLVNTVRAVVRIARRRYDHVPA